MVLVITGRPGRWGLLARWTAPGGAVRSAERLGLDGPELMAEVQSIMDRIALDRAENCAESAENRAMLIERDR